MPSVSYSASGTVPKLWDIYQIRVLLDMVTICIPVVIISKNVYVTVGVTSTATNQLRIIAVYMYSEIDACRYLITTIFQHHTAHILH